MFGFTVIVSVCNSLARLKAFVSFVISLSMS